MDTNILLAASDADRQQHHDCTSLLQAALLGTISLYSSGQIFREYLAVATRPIRDNGLGMSTDEAVENVKEFRKCVQMLEEVAGTSERLMRLVREHQVSGKRIHDANLAAVMLEHGLVRLVTLNTADFKCSPQLQLLEPGDVPTDFP